MSRLEISQVAIVHDGRPIIPSISFQVAEASTCALLGPSGSGKSSLLRIIAGIDHHPTAHSGAHHQDRKSIV